MFFPRTALFASLIASVFCFGTLSAQEILLPGGSVKNSATKASASSGSDAESASTEAASGEGVDNQISIFNAKGGQAVPMTSSPSRPDSEIYQGIIPGSREQVDHLAEGGEENTVMWVGFRANEKNTNVFIQTSSEARYVVGSDGMGGVTVTFRDTGVSSSNFQRFIDTSFFGRSVRMIETEKSGGDVVVRIARNGSEEPTVRKDGNFVHLTFADVE